MVYETVHINIGYQNIVTFRVGIMADRVESGAKRRPLARIAKVAAVNGNNVAALSADYRQRMFQDAGLTNQDIANGAVKAELVALDRIVFINCDGERL